MKLTLGSMVLDSFWLGSILVIVLTGIYTVLGGLRAVAYTEAIQTVILVIGSLLLTIFGLDALGGWDKLREVCGSEMFNLWKPLVPKGVEFTWAPVKDVTTTIDAATGDIIRSGKMAWYFNDNYPWLGMLFCAPIIGLWYWCTDQYIVQRALGAPNEKEARRGSICASFFKLLPVFIFIIPGMICFAIAKTGGNAEIAKALIDDNGQIIRSEAQKAFPLLVLNILPDGVRGIVVAGLLAALMSSLAGVFNACSTLFTIDFYSKFKPKATQHQLVWVGRVATAIMVFIGLLWIPVIRGSKGLYDYLQGVQSYLAPPIFVVFFFGVFWKRLNAKGCLSALIIGFALGLIRLGIDTPVKLFGTTYPVGSFLWIMNNMFFQYYSILILIVCIIVMVVVSYLTKAPSYEKISGLTYGTITAEHRKESRSSWSTIDVALSVLLCVLILGAYLYFRG
jgi:SSS family solute:Na+ symporter